MNRMKIKIIAGILVVFSLGVIIGALGAGIFIHRGMRQFIGGERLPLQGFFMRRLTRELKLTDEQKPKVQQILKASEAEMREFLQHSHAEFEKIMQRQNAQLKEILTPVQQKKLDEMFEQMQNRWRKKPDRKDRR